MLYNLTQWNFSGVFNRKKFISNSHISLILGDNLFHGNQLISMLEKADKKNKGATVFAYTVKDAERYGVIELNKKGKS